MLLPKKVKHRKWQKGRKRGLGTAQRASAVSYGDFGLKSETHGWITSRQIEAVRRVLTRYVRRGGKIWIRIFPDRPVGGGKGSPDHYVAVVKPGTVLFEMGGITKESAVEAMRLGGHKLGIRTKFVVKQ